MKKLKSLTKLIAASATALIVSNSAAVAQDANADANNPLASVTAFNIQNYFIDSFTGPSGADGNQFWLRYATPLQLGESNWLFRASLPYNSFPVGAGGSTVNGIGDLDLFMAYQFDAKPGVSFGLGPTVVIPTATDDRIGADQWQLGLANVYFNGTNPKYQYGYLAIYRAGVGSTPAGRQRPNLFAFQPIYFWQLGNGWYTGGAPIWTYDFSTDNYNIPIGIRLGKVVQYGKTTANYFVEPQWSVASRGAGQPEFQIYAAINLQFR